MFFGTNQRPTLRHKAADGAPLRILAIRVDFPPPRPEDRCGVSGDGTFDLSGEDAPDRAPGAPPHDKRYFEGLLEGLRRYWAVQSRGALVLEYEVKPNGQTSAYRMPHRTAYYSYYQDPNDLSEREHRLARLAVDALAAADEDSTVTLGAFDSYIVFHAGGDWQHDYAGDSPCDLVTAYIPSLERLLGYPVVVDGGAHVVDDVIVMPEAINQDLDPSREIACLHSELAHEFGHQLGLLDLYDYAYFSNVVGYWDLMDNGDGMAFEDQHGRVMVGVLPPSISVFSKQWLGWVHPEELVDGTFQVTASTLAPSAYRITVSDHEYFLIENRQTDTDGDPTVYLKADHGVILGPTTALGDTTTNEYDAGLPGSGLLIWHIDTSVGLWDRGLPNYLEYDARADTLIRHRGVALEEADGIENIGIQHFESAVSPPGRVPVDPAGGPRDPFRRGNNDRFGDDTKPASWDNRGRRTHVEVSGISETAPVMTFTFTRTWRQPGWPVSVAQGPLSPPSVVTTSEGERVVLVCGRGRVYAVGRDRIPVALWDSRQLMTNTPSAIRVPDEREFLVASSAQGGRVALFPLKGAGAGTPLPGWPQAPTGRALSPPVLADLDGDGEPEVAVGSEDGKACLLSLDGRMKPGWPVSLGDVAVAAPAVADLDGDGMRELVFSAKGVTALTISGRPLPGWPSLREETLAPPLVADLEGDGTVEVVVASSYRVWVVGPEGRVLPGWPVRATEDLVPAVAIVDVDADGFLDVVACDVTGGLWAWSSQGNPVADCVGGGSGGGPPCALLAWDATGNGRPEFLRVSPSRADLRAPGGRPLPGWPLSVPPLTGATVADLDGDGDLEAVFSDSTGSLHAWDLPYETTQGWFFPRADEAMTGWAGFGTAGSIAAVVEAADFYVWPSPVRGRGFVSFRASPGASVSLTVFDPAGRRRALWEGTATGQRQDWSLDAVLPMGVYVCKLDVRHGGTHRSLFHRFAVTKED